MSFELGALLSMLGQKPEMAAQLDAIGAPVPDLNTLKNYLGGPKDVTPAAFQPPVQPNFGPQAPTEDTPPEGVSQLGTQAPFDTTVNPAAPETPGGGSAPGTQSNSASALAGLQGVKMPAPPTPIMNGGVSGGVKPPDMHASAAGSQQMLQGILQALLTQNHPTQPTVPTLGGLMR